MKLNDLMDFDHVIYVAEDGTVSEPRGIYAPNLFEGELDSVMTGHSWTVTHARMAMEGR